jgi:hypothetical protein
MKSVLPRMKISICISITLFCCNWAFAQFTEISNTLPVYTVLQTNSYGSGISFYDFNDDGWDDLSIGNSTNAPLFFVNNQGQLEPASFSIPNINNKAIMALLWADIDNDGDTDIFITKEFGAPELWINDGNFNFTNLAVESGIYGENQRYMGAALCDYDHDGFLDLYVCIYSHPSTNLSLQTSQLFRNNGDGTFTDVTVFSGVFLPPRPTFQPVFTDVNGDGWEDLYLIIDRIEFRNELFINNGDGTFTNVSAGSGSDVYVCSMTGTVGDFDNDGDLDTYVTSNLTTGNVLLKNEGDNTFTDVAEELGVVVDSYCWGSLWLDYDNDSWQDLFVGATQDTGPPISYFFRNEGGITFSDFTYPSNVNSSPNKTYVCAKGDLNMDGYYDFATVNRAPITSKLFQNNGGTNSYLSITLKGVYSNPDGIGNWIHCYANGNHYVRFTHCGENLFAQDSGKNIFGLGTSSMVDSLVINWNRGLSETYYNVPVNQHLVLYEGGSLTQAFDITGTTTTLCPNTAVLLTAPFGQSYLWSTGENTQSISVDTPGVYSVTVFHEFGFVGNSNPYEIGWAPEPQITQTIEHASCFGENNGWLLVELLEGTISEILWNEGSTTNYLLGLNAGDYTYELTNEYNCQYEGVITILQPDSLQANLSINNVACFSESSGSVTANPTGGNSPIEIYWQGFNPLSLSAGTFNYLLIDFNACSFEGTFTITQPDELTVELIIENAIEDESAGSAVVIINGGTPPFSVLWSNGETDYSIFDLSPGPYNVIVTDSNDCSTTVSFTILLLTSIFDLNNNVVKLFPNPTNGVLFFKSNLTQSINIKIFDNTGRICFEDEILNAQSPINLRSLKAGLYHVEISIDGNKSYNRLVKE